MMGERKLFHRWRIIICTCSGMHRGLERREKNETPYHNNIGSVNAYLMQQHTTLS